jgi:L-threonylcarbamoyladenylate synthase
VHVLRDGGVIAYPTEAVFGLGCLPDDMVAIARVLEIKRRSWRKGLLLIAADVAQVEEWAVLPSGALGREIMSSWPGPTTWVLPARPHVAAALTGGRNTIAMRVTDHPVGRALCLRAAMPIVSTSANVSNNPPIRHPLVLRRWLGREVDYIVPGALGGRLLPTSIRDGSSGAVLRADEGRTPGA